MAISINKLRNEDLLKSLKNKVVHADCQEIREDFLVTDHQVVFRELISEAVSKVKEMEKIHERYFNQLMKKFKDYEGRTVERKILQE